MNRARWPELLAPAGSPTHMDYALAYGADAVYAGLPRYSLRVRNNQFREANLGEAIDRAHRLGRRFYLACNVMPHGAKARTFVEDLAPIVAMGPDALIMADPGLIALARQHWPQMPIHLSVQANTVNAAAVRFWRSVGVSRVILSRELSLKEIAEIREDCPEAELEVFVHGALCIAYSGRCLLSGYFNHRDANQGTCTNACRWTYQVRPPEVGERHPAADQIYFLEETERPGQYLPIEEDEQGTYVLNSRDLRAVEHVPALCEIGVDCLKIEGRTKSVYYVARTTRVYRAALDAASRGEGPQAALHAELENLAHRGYTDGFLQRHADAELQNYLQGASGNARQIFVANVLDDADTTRPLWEIRNKVAVGDRLELITPSGCITFDLEAMERADGTRITEAPGAGYRVRMPLPSAPGPHGLLCRILA